MELKLTKTQKKFMPYILKGYCPRDISEITGVSYFYTRECMDNLFKSAGVNTRAEFMALFIPEEIKEGYKNEG